jgi:hypothetical protein
VFGRVPSVELRQPGVILKREGVYGSRSLPHGAVAGTVNHGIGGFKRSAQHPIAINLEGCVLVRTRDENMHSR